MDTFAATPARVAFSSPSRLPILGMQTVVRAKVFSGRSETYRTEVAMLSAKGAWYVVDAETSRTDCVASATGPSLREESAQTCVWPGTSASNAQTSGNCKKSRQNMNIARQNAYSRPTSSQDHHSDAVWPVRWRQHVKVSSRVGAHQRLRARAARARLGS